ncbi:hypothetical protein BC936DRAFT_143394 [Jimgerdemannia flammicorona]|uniref:4'-phosphopantetheinyl transferase domain-containing protein n=1 Tax=Jimgerdemannia flammicorona TaxID=994334 RepID=A0A433DE00_9FUNG|nr:hypothetical protein BC936DRAFT_143394 [Jimgerdemannia flammicorona]
MIVGIGVDILHLPRLRALVSRRPNSGELLARRILSPGEVAEFRDVVDSGDGGASKVIMYLASSYWIHDTCLPIKVGRKGGRIQGTVSAPSVNVEGGDDGETRRQTVPPHRRRRQAWHHRCPRLHLARRRVRDRAGAARGTGGRGGRIVGDWSKDSPASS